MPATDSATASLEQQVRARVDEMSYLPTTAAVAMKFIELGKRPEAEPSEYARVISSDSSLSTKILGLANSSWFGVRNKVTRPLVAVNLLGIGTVRTLAISYCLTGLHNDLRLSTDESRLFWSSSLCKAVAARQFALIVDPTIADEAFAAGLFQDFAMPVMFACDRSSVRAILDDSTLGVLQRQAREQALFKLDHADLGRSIAEKLGLPELFIDAIAFHHRRDHLAESAHPRAFVDAVHTASLFPHSLHQWNPTDADELSTFLTDRLSAHRITVETFLARVQKEFDQLYAYFESGDGSTVDLSELLIHATREVADSTTRLVGTVNELLSQAADAGREVRALMDQQDRLQQAAQRDPLTESLNRHGLHDLGNQLIAKAARYRMGIAVAYFDVDRFKQLNDAHGHPYGDAVLKHVASTMRQVVRPHDLVGRVGGDEFVIVLPDCSKDHAEQVIGRLIAQVAASSPVCPESATRHAHRITLSAGLHWRQVLSSSDTLANMIAEADQAMYHAKRAGGNAVRAA